MEGFKPLILGNNTIVVQLAIHSHNNLHLCIYSAVNRMELRCLSTEVRVNGDRRIRDDIDDEFDPFEELEEDDETDDDDDEDDVDRSE